MAELRGLRTDHPELGPAIDLQIELLDIQRRAMPRISLPASLLTPVAPVLDPEGRSLLTWSLVPLDWTAFRAILRETTDALARSGNIEQADARFLTDLARDGNRLPTFIEAWFRDRVEGLPWPNPPTPDIARIADGSFDNALSLAFRPVLTRCADAVGPRLNLETWLRAWCPLCHAEPDLAIVSHSLDRLLVCARCTLRWPYPDHRCPFCENTDPDRLTTFASPDGVHRLVACEACHRYLRAYDERYGRRPAMPSVDAIAMLPLDALAYQRGYAG